MSDPKRTHHMDQSTALRRDVARLLYSYYRSLQTEGFTAEEAFRLVVRFEGWLHAPETAVCPCCGRAVS